MCSWYKPVATLSHSVTITCNMANRNFIDDIAITILQIIIIKIYRQSFSICAEQNIFNDKVSAHMLYL